MINFDEEGFEIVDYYEPEILINPNPIIEPYTPYIPPIKQPKKPIQERIKNIYNDDDFAVDLFVEEKMIRVSVFDDGHFQDEMFIRKEDYCG